MNERPSLLIKPEFPRSAKYDPDWMMDNQMGPNALWLMEWLCEALELEPGLRVLDLGCGKAMTSIFLAREFGVRVYAADLWMSPDHNWRRAAEAAVEDLVCPVKAEAHALYGACFSLVGTSVLRCLLPGRLDISVDRPRMEPGGGCS
jgi:SAM-dependent methyltransferase